MITVEEADKIIFENITMFSKVKIPLEESYGMILQEDLIADRNLPPFNRVTMDGIAINFSSWESGNRIFPVEGMQKSGIPSSILKDQNSCIEAMTGAVLPEGCDCVIPVEEIDIENNQAKIKDGMKPQRLMNIHEEGSDYELGTKLVARGTRLISVHIAVAAAVGKSDVLVAKSPKIAVIGTGDELVGVDQEPKMYQIRESNSYALHSALTLNGYKNVTCFQMNDEKEELRSKIQKILDEYTALILSGGVSKGKFDFVPEILDKLGVKKLFHKVKQRPGKPFWFGISKKGVPVFALPGNPVSTQIGAYRYVLPYLHGASGMNSKPQEMAILNQDVRISTPLTHFLPIQLRSEENGHLFAAPITLNGSGDFASLAKTDGFIELKSGIFEFPKGTSAPFYRW